MLPLNVASPCRAVCSRTLSVFVCALVFRPFVTLSRGAAQCIPALLARLDA